MPLFTAHMLMVEWLFFKSDQISQLGFHNLGVHVETSSIPMTAGSSANVYFLKHSCILGKDIETTTPGSLAWGCERIMRHVDYAYQQHTNWVTVICIDRIPLSLPPSSFPHVVYWSKFSNKAAGIGPYFCSRSPCSGFGSVGTMLAGT